MRWVRGFFAAVAAVLLGGSLTLSVLRNVDTGPRLFTLAASFASYAVFGYLLTLLIAVLLVRKASSGRTWLATAAAVCVIGLGLHGWWLAPQFLGDGKGRHADLTLLTVNLQYGLADPASVVRAAAEQKVDVLVLEEVTFDEYARLKRAGLLDLLPQVAGKPDYSAAGTMVFSAYPLGDTRSFAVSNGGLSVKVGLTDPFRLIAAHPSQPLDDPAIWRRDLGAIETAARASMRGGPTVVAGDFNATLDHARFRELLGSGLTDAVRSAGSGWQPTWPEALPRSHGSDGVRGAWLRPVIAIDHVLFSSQYAAVSTRTLPVPGTDHRGLLVRLDRL